VRTYGFPPFDVALLHGGPGAAGEMALVAEALSKQFSVLEPLQSALSVEGQINELHEALPNPVTLIGHSWGAMLGYLFAARYPPLVKKLILVGSGVFEEKYAKSIMQTRYERFNEEEKKLFERLIHSLKEPGVFTELGKLIGKVDAYDPIGESSLEASYEIYQSVWPEVVELRKREVFLELGEAISCPVLAIHGEYDPHPLEGIIKPLSRVLKDFRFILLPMCGHTPWLEKQARNRFFEILGSEIQNIDHQ